MQISPLKKQKELHFQTLFLALGVAFLFFIPFILSEEGYFLFYGDFNVQQIPFYQMCHEKVRSGQIFWDWNTDLGANFIGSYSFYLLGSPFFWLTLPFPNWMVPHLMGPLLILKFGCAAFTAYFYLRRFTKTPNAAMLGGLLYAFSGFSVYNIFFNHFHEAIVFFPLLLLALELFIAENRRGPLIFAAFICALSNYFFFFGMAVFCVIYWFVRMLGGRWHLNMGRLLVMVLEILLGVALAAALLVPAYLSVMQNDRVSSNLYGWDAFLYGREQLYLNIIEVFFFPPDLPARPVFFNNADVKWASLGGWLPLFGMTGVCAWLRSKKKSWLRRIIIICAVMALVPILNSAFFAFNSAYYARWFYMPILMMCLATVLSVEDTTVDFAGGFKIAAIITAIFTLVIGLFPAGIDDETGKFTGIGLYTDSTDGVSTYFWRFWITCGIAIASLIILRVLMCMRKKSYRVFMRSAIAVVCIISVGYAAYFIDTGKSHGYEAKEVMIDQLIEGEVNLPDKESMSYRIDVYDGVDNTGMYLGYPCIQAFHSIVPKSIMDFYPAVGVDRGVGSRPETSQKALRSLLSTKYLLDRSGGDDFADDDGRTEMPGWKFYKSEGGYKIYENENFIPYGFTYDYYITPDQCDTYSETNRAHMMLKAIILDEEQVECHRDILKSLDTDYAVLGDDANGNPISSKGGKTGISFSANALKEDAAARRRETATDFVATTNGFTASITLSKENLVFFSVPYEADAWTAFVDGEAVEIEVVNVGFMAVRVPEGRHSIEFKYTTPGLAVGIKLSVAAAVGIVLYLAVVWILRRRKPERWVVEYPEGEELAQISEELQAYLNGTDLITQQTQEQQDVPPKANEPVEDTAHLLDRIFAEEEQPAGAEQTAQRDAADHGIVGGFVIRTDDIDE